MYNFNTTTTNNNIKIIRKTAVLNVKMCAL